MVKIVTGKIDSGKTTNIRKIFNETQKGDGIVSQKVMLDKDVFGYNGMRLSDKYTFPFMIHEKFYKEDVLRNGKIYEKDFLGEIGPYKIYKKSIKKLRKLYKDFFKRKINPIYFDEIGVLELKKGGFYKPLKKALNQEKDIIMTVREDLVQSVVNYFEIKEYEIVK